MILPGILAPERQFKFAFSIAVPVAAAGVAATPGKDGHDFVPEGDGGFLSRSRVDREQENPKTPVDPEMIVHPTEPSYRAGEVPSVKFAGAQAAAGEECAGNSRH